MDFLFVYGTLLRNAGFPVSKILQENSRFYDSGTFPGKLYEVGEYPGAVYLPEAESVVYGNILELKNAEFVLTELDKYEEVGEEFPAPNEYVRIRIPVNCPSGEIFMCWVYLYNWPTEELKQITSGKYPDFPEADF